MHRLESRRIPGADLMHEDPRTKPDRKVEVGPIGVGGDETRGGRGLADGAFAGYLRGGWNPHT
jgi:hypothetical protein